LRMAHRAGPGAAHLGRIAPAAFDDHERVEQFLFPIGAPARLAPGQGRERGKDRAEMILLHHWVAEGGFHSPQAEQGDGRDAIILLDAGKERREFLGALLAKGYAPFGDAAVEVGLERGIGGALHGAGHANFDEVGREPEVAQEGLRHAETRYRLLFQIASQPLLIVDANSLKVVEANPAAGELLNKTAKRLSGRAFLELFNTEGGKAVQAHLAQVKATGRADEIIASLNEGKKEAMVGASLFRQDNAAHFLVRLSPLQADLAQPRSGSKLFRVVESLPDGFVVTDLDRRILTANPAFLDLAELASEEQARGEQLDRWLGRPGVDLDALIANLREHSSVRHFNTILRGEYGASEEVELSAVSVPSGEHPCYGFTIRIIGVQKPSKPRRPRELPRSVEQLTQLVGRVTLKELVRETTDVIERLCIETALELTGDNRASAAEMLGLSRQSLYSKLRRFGLGDLDSESNSEDDER